MFQFYEKPLMAEALDLFCGAGGLSLGLMDAGIKVVAGIDTNKDALATFRESHAGAEAVNADIAELAISGALRKYKNIDLIVGGPPCQGFCAINPNRHPNDPRNSGIDAFLKVVEELSPTAVCIENVTGLLTLGSGFGLEKIENFFTQKGYKHVYRVLQAAHYGVPQSRWRFIFLASKTKSPKHPIPTHCADIRPYFKAGKTHTFSVGESDLFTPKLEIPNSIRDAISDLPQLLNGEKLVKRSYMVEAKSKYQKRMRNESDEITSHWAKALGPENMDRVMALPNQGDCWHNLPDHLVPANLLRMKDKYGSSVGTRTRFKRLVWSELFSTILTSPDPYWGAFIHPEQNRVISVREAARAQSFPDCVKFFGGLTSQYTQVGNAVPPMLGRAIGESLLKCI